MPLPPLPFLILSKTSGGATDATSTFSRLEEASHSEASATSTFWLSGGGVVEATKKVVVEPLYTLQMADRAGEILVFSRSSSTCC